MTNPNESDGTGNRRHAASRLRVVHGSNPMIGPTVGVRRLSPVPVPLGRSFSSGRVLATLLLVPVLAVVAGCSGGGSEAKQRSVVVLSADEDVEIVLPDDAFTQPIETTTTTTTLATTTTTTLATTTATTTTTTTTTTEPPKETIPLAEEDINPGLKLMDTLEDFNECLDSEGYSFIGIPNEELGSEDPVNQPEYLEALGLCNSRTNIATVFQEFQTSRAELTPEQIRQENEDFIDMADCLRRKGWAIGELAPDENGLLGPGGEFSSPDGGIDGDDIRACISELNLNVEDDQ